MSSHGTLLERVRIAGAHGVGQISIDLAPTTGGPQERISSTKSEIHVFTVSGT